MQGGFGNDIGNLLRMQDDKYKPVASKALGRPKIRWDNKRHKEKQISWLNIHSSEPTKIEKICREGKD